MKETNKLSMIPFRFNIWSKYLDLEFTSQV